MVHRAHLHGALHDLAVDLGVEVRTAQKVIDFKEGVPAVVLSDGETVAGDLIVAADGGSCFAP